MNDEKHEQSTGEYRVRALQRRVIHTLVLHRQKACFSLPLSHCFILSSSSSLSLRSQSAESNHVLSYMNLDLYLLNTRRSARPTHVRSLQSQTLNSQIAAKLGVTTCLIAHVTGLGFWDCQCSGSSHRQNIVSIEI